MPQHSLPPVPLKLREMLADYPDLIERVQEALISSSEMSKRVPLSPFDDAISALEGRLEAFASEARMELKAAEATGDQLLIGAARDKESLTSRARHKRHWITDDRLLNHFGVNFK